MMQAKMQALVEKEMKSYREKLDAEYQKKEEALKRASSSGSGTTKSFYDDPKWSPFTTQDKFNGKHIGPT